MRISKRKKRARLVRRKKKRASTTRVIKERKKVRVKCEYNISHECGWARNLVTAKRTNILGEIGTVVMREVPMCDKHMQEFKKFYAIESKCACA